MVHDIADEIAAAGAMAFDIEFVSEARYVAELAVLQVAWGDPDDPEIAAIDCLVADPAPIVALIASPDVDVIAHSARQDLGLLAIRSEINARAFWDTQIAAAFVGVGDQIGYGNLVHRLLGVKLDKAQQFTDWLKRPLTDRQLRYVMDDVRYLPAAWRELRRRLDACGRLSWVREESARLAASVGPLPPAEDAYQEVKGWRGLRGGALASLQALAAWRQTEALARNKPLSWILADRAMIEACQSRARSYRDLRSIRGIGDGISRRYGAAIIEAVASGARQPPPEPDLPSKPNLSARAQVWASIITNLVQARCAAANIAPRFVATRAEAEILAAWYDRGDRAVEPDVDLLGTWRRELAGDAALAWLRGDLVIAVSDERSAIELREP